MICERSLVATVRRAGLAALCLPDELELGKIFNPAIRRLWQNHRQLDRNCPNPFTQWAELVKPVVAERVRRLSPCCFLSSLFGAGLARVLAAEFAVPWCLVNPGFYFGFRTTEEGSDDFSPLGYRMYRYWLSPVVLHSDLALHATDRLFDGNKRDLPPGNIYCGPLFWEASGAVPQAFFEPGHPWVLVSLSMAAQENDEQIVKAAVSALVKMELRVLVTVGRRHDRRMLKAVPENVLVCGYIPHSLVMPECRLVISHGGHGTVMKAIRYRTPLLLVPWGRDQPGVSRRARAMGVAGLVARTECNESSLAAAIATILDDGEIRKKLLQHSVRFGGEDSLDAACRAVQDMLG